MSTLQPHLVHIMPCSPNTMCSAQATMQLSMLATCRHHRPLHLAARTPVLPGAVMASLKEEIERLTAEIKEKEGEIKGLREQKRASKDAGEKAELLEQIDALEAGKNRLIDQRNKLQDHLAGTARGTGRWGPNSSCCILADSHLFCVLPP